MSHAADPWSPPEADFPDEGSPSDKLRFLVPFAVLAPSSHNSQPWLFRVAADALEVHADPSRALPVVDPRDRELVTSCGAALFNARVALRRFAHMDEVEVVAGAAPRGGQHPDLLARLRVGRRRAPSREDLELFEAIRARRTCRGPFRDREVPPALLGALRGAAEAEGAWLHAAHGEERDAIADLVAEGDRIQASDPAFRRELAAWIHPNRSRSRDGMPGYAFGAGELASYLEPLVVRTFDWGDGQAAQDRRLAEGSPVLAVLGTPEDDAASWLAAGQALQRVLLRACVDEVSASFLNQPVEVPELRARLRELLGRPGYPQLVLRMGYGEAPRPTPRRGAADVMV
ncbi:MAG: nitroreductase family protein [Polyangiaceae bacterium]|nr:nitroreductase family protein [Polyangiaceae bacterium]